MRSARTTCTSVEDARLAGGRARRRRCGAHAAAHRGRLLGVVALVVPLLGFLGCFHECLVRDIVVVVDVPVVTFDVSSVDSINEGDTVGLQ